MSETELIRRVEALIEDMLIYGMLGMDRHDPKSPMAQIERGIMEWRKDLYRSRLRGEVPQ